MEDHIQHLRVVLGVLESHQLFSNEKKCLFGQSQLEDIGHVILGCGVAADMSKIQAMVDRLVPSTLRDLHPRSHRLLLALCGQLWEYCMAVDRTT